MVNRKRNNSNIKLSSLFTPRQVICRIATTDRVACIRALIGKMKQSGVLSNAEAAVKAVLDREALGSTMAAPGLAVPHARVEGVSAPAIAVATSPEGIPFGRDPSERANVIVLILSGPEALGDYLQVLAGVARAFSEPSLVTKVAHLPTPEAVWEFFDKGALPDFVTAADMMRTKFVALRHTDTLARAIDAFVQHDLEEIPVLDDDGDLVGIVAEEEILKLCLPEYLLWIEDLEPILHFQPFDDVLKDEHETRVAEIMSKKFVTVSEDTPAIQVARELLRAGIRKLYVARGKKLVGVITLSHFLKRVCRG